MDQSSLIGFAQIYLVAMLVAFLLALPFILLFVVLLIVGGAVRLVFALLNALSRALLHEPRPRERKRRPHTGHSGTPRLSP